MFVASEDYEDVGLKLDERLIRRPAATFFLNAAEDAPQAGVKRGDLLIVDRAEAPGPGRVVVAAGGGELRVLRLPPAWSAGAVEVWGVVVGRARPKSLRAVVECNNFFVSCERAFAPKLQGRPVVVLSNNDGCVISRSDEAKALGIPMGAPFFEVRALALEQRVAVISANHELYVDMSRRVSCVLARHAQELEAYSIDESFLRLPDGKNEDWARTVRSEVGRWTGLPVAVGLGPTKVLAKLAADLAKKKGGVFSLCDETARAEVLAGLPLTSVWGLAAASARRLGVYGLRTAQDLAQARDGAVRDAVGVMGLKLAAELRGQSCLPFNHAPAPRQSLTVSRSFAEAVEGRDPLWSAVATFACQAGERLRRHGLAAGELRVFVGWRRDGQAEGEPGCEKLTPASATPALLEAARAAFERVFRED